MRCRPSLCLLLEVQECSIDLVNGCFILKGRHITDGLPSYHSVYNPTHYLGAASLGKLRDEEYLFQGRNGSHLLPHPITKLAVKLPTRCLTSPQYHERHRHLALQLIRHGNDRRLCYGWMLYQHGLQLVGAQSVTGHFDHLVGSS